MVSDNSYSGKPNNIIKVGKGILFFISIGMLSLLTILMYWLSKSDASGWGAAIIMVILFLFAVFWLFVVARLISPIIAEWIARKFSQDVFYPGDDTREAPPEYAELRAKIVKGDIHDAMKRLEVIRLENSQNPFVVNLMADVYIDVSRDYKNAALLLIDFLKKPSRNDGDVVFVMKLTDVFIETHKDILAIELLKGEIKKKYSPKALEKLNKRLIGIQS